MKKLASVVILVGLFSCEQPINQSTVNYEGEIILVGKITLDGILRDETFKEWYDYFYENVEINTNQLESIRTDIQDVRIRVFLGTWCSDSQEQVPPFMRMLRYIDYDIESIELIALEKLEDKALVSPQGQEKEQNITHVPTFIFYRHGNELGRIIEFPEVTLEVDMAEIVSR